VIFQVEIGLLLLIVAGFPNGWGTFKHFSHWPHRNMSCGFHISMFSFAGVQDMGYFMGYEAVKLTTLR
jgi:hypothetical protein